MTDGLQTQQENGTARRRPPVRHRLALAWNDGSYQAMSYCRRRAVPPAPRAERGRSVAVDSGGGWVRARAERGGLGGITGGGT